MDFGGAQDDDKQIFLAETGLGGMREVPRDVVSRPDFWPERRVCR